MLTGPPHSCLNAAANNRWNDVFILLEGTQLPRRYWQLSERDPSHPWGFRIFDYAEINGNEYIKEKLLNLGAMPSFDIKIFMAAQAGDWKCVFNFLSKAYIDINCQDQRHPEGWTLLDYAMCQNEFTVINQLLGCGAKSHETLNEWKKYWQQCWEEYLQQYQQEEPPPQTPLSSPRSFSPYYQKTKTTNREEANDNFDNHPVISILKRREF